MTTYTTIDQLNLNTEAIQSFIEAKANSERELFNAKDGIEDANAKVGGLKKQAMRGEKVSPTTLANANANAGVTLAEERLKGATRRYDSVMAKSITSDLTYIQTVAPELSTIFDGKVDVLYGLGEAPKTIPEGYSKPLLVITQSKDAKEKSTWLKGELTITYFREELHKPLSEDMLNRDIGANARSLRVQSVNEFSHADVAKIVCDVRPEIITVTRPLSKGEVLTGIARPYMHAFYGCFGKRFGETTSGLKLDGTVQRVKPVNSDHSHFDSMGNKTTINSASIDENGTQTVTATIEGGWTILRPRANDSRFSSPLEADVFPDLIQSDKDLLIGAVDRNLGRITKVHNISAQTVGGSNCFKVTMKVTTVSKV